MAPLLVSMVQNSAAPVSPDNLPAILQKDAIYAAVGKKNTALLDKSCLQGPLKQWSPDGLSVKHVEISIS